MINNQTACADVRAQKLQRLTMGILLFVSYALHYRPLVLAVAPEQSSVPTVPDGCHLTKEKFLER